MCKCTSKISLSFRRSGGSPGWAFRKKFGACRACGCEEDTGNIPNKRTKKP